MAEINIDLSDFDDDDLADELISRGYVVEDINEVQDYTPSRKKLPVFYSIKLCFDNKELRTHLENITGCGGYVSNEELLNQLKYLLENG